MLESKVIFDGFVYSYYCVVTINWMCQGLNSTGLIFLFLHENNDRTVRTNAISFVSA